MVSTYCGPRHAQYTKDPQVSLDNLKFVVNIKKSLDAGLSYDTIIVNYDSAFEVGKEWLDSINDSKTKNGKLYVLHRESKGRNVAAFSYGYETFKSDYDYFMFIQDDHIRAGFKTPFGCYRLQSSWDCVVGKNGSRRTSVRLRANFTSGLAHNLFARSRCKISFETSSRHWSYGHGGWPVRLENQIYLTPIYKLPYDQHGSSQCRAMHTLFAATRLLHRLDERTLAGKLLSTYIIKFRRDVDALEILQAVRRD